MKPISFTPEVLKAKLRALEEYGRFMTRRPLKHDAAPGVPVSEPGWKHAAGRTWTGCDDEGTTIFARSAYAQGDVIWLRERARVFPGSGPARVRIRYELDGKSAFVDWPDRLKTPQFGKCIANGIYREGARHFFEVVSVKAERACDISVEDAVLEGIQRFGYEWTFNGGLHLSRTTQESFKAIWASIYGPDAWEQWCWAYTLRRAKP